MQLKKTTKDSRTIARELNVRYVFEGSVHKVGNRVRIVANSDGLTDSPVWAEKYSGTLEDVFDQQAKLSRSIVDAMQLTLGPEASRRIADRPIANIQAFEPHVRAHRFTDEGLNRALQLWREALSIAGNNEMLFATMGKAWVSI